MSRVPVWGREIQPEFSWNRWGEIRQKIRRDKCSVGSQSLLDQPTPPGPLLSCKLSRCLAFGGMIMAGRSIRRFKRKMLLFTV